MASDDRPRPLHPEDEDDARGGASGASPARAETQTTTPTAPRPSVAAAEVVHLPTADRAGKKAAKVGKKEKKLLRDAHRPLDSWERYRALSDVVDEAVDLVDLADHKARFALVIMGALNALLFVLASQTDVFDAIPASSRGAITAVIVLYGLIALYFVLQAIESLRPRKAQPQVRYASETGLEDFPVGLRFYEDILSRDLEAYRRSWRELRIGQLNAELAVQAHALAQINKAKYAALRKLYFGLKLMTVMAVLLLAVGSYFVLSGKARQLDHRRKNSLFAAPEPAPGTFAEPHRFAQLGVKEPSGIAFQPRSGHLFVVGDDATLAELDMSGQVTRAGSLRGNLEDVAVHTPSGNLVVLSELTSELIFYDPAAARELKRWKIDKAAALGRTNSDPNQGFEGLAFRPDPSLPGGGMFYLAHQRGPAEVVAIAFDVNRPAGVLGADVVKGRWEVSGYEDLTAVTYVADLDRLLVISDAKDVLIVMHTDGTVERELPIPGKQQEGIAIDGEGSLWIADDKDKSVLKVPGGLDVLGNVERQSPDGRGTGLRIPG